MPCKVFDTVVVLYTFHCADLLLRSCNVPRLYFRTECNTVLEYNRLRTT